MEIIHIMAGPVVGMVITALAFSDDYVIRRKVKSFFDERNVNIDLADAIEAMISGGIALATFLGNVYLFIVNLVIATIVFPESYHKIVTWIGLFFGLIVIVQAVYILVKYRVLDIGEVSPIGTMRYDKFLRIEQVILSLGMTIYFAVGILLEHGLL